MFFKKQTQFQFFGYSNARPVFLQGKCSAEGKYFDQTWKYWFSLILGAYPYGKLVNVVHIWYMWSISGQLASKIGKISQNVSSCRQNGAISATTGSWASILRRLVGGDSTARWRSMSAQLDSYVSASSIVWPRPACQIANSWKQPQYRY